MAKKVKNKLTKLEGEFDIEELAKKYKLTEEKIVKRLNDIIEEEERINEENGLEPLTENDLKDLVSRSFRLEMKSHLVSKAVPVIFKVMAKRDMFDYAKKRRKDLSDLFSIDKEKAIKDGIADAVCTDTGEVVYKDGTFNKGIYPEHKYIYTLILLITRADLEGEEKEKFGYRSLSFKVYEDEDLKFFNALQEEHWYESKIIIDDLDKFDEKNYNLTGKFSSVSEIEELPEKEQKKLNTNLIYIDISPKTDKNGKIKKDGNGKPVLKNKGLIFSNILGQHRLNLIDSEEYYNKFVDNGYVPVERYVIVISDVVSISDTGKSISIMDNSIEKENKLITVFDNRGDKTVTFGPKSKILIFGEIRYDITQKKVSINMISAKIIPREQGGHFYPRKIEKIEEIKKPEKEDKKETPKKEKKTTKTTKKPKDKKKIKVDQKMVNEDIQTKIVETLYTMDNGGSYEEILESTESKDDDIYKNSFFDLIDREIVKENNGVYEIY